MSCPSRKPYKHWVHVIFRKRQQASADYILKIVETCQGGVWTHELRENEEVLQMSIPCDPGKGVMAAADLMALAEEHKLLEDFVKVKAIFTCNSTYLSKKDIQEALDFKEDGQTGEPSTA